MLRAPVMTFIACMRRPLSDARITYSPWRTEAHAHAPAAPSERHAMLAAFYFCDRDDRSRVHSSLLLRPQADIPCVPA